MMGGDPAAAKHHYARIKEIAGDQFLLADVYFARYYLYQMQDRKRFETILGSIATDRSAGGPYRLMNTIAGIRARAYLAAAGDLFQE